MKRSSPFERNEDRRAIRTGYEGFGGATAVRADELDGYGSTTRWAPPDLDAEAVLVAVESGHSKCAAIAKAADLDVRTAAAVLGRLVERGEITRSPKGTYRKADVRALVG